MELMYAKFQISLWVFLLFICWVTGGKGEKGENKKGKGSQIHGDGREWTLGGKHTM